MPNYEYRARNMTGRIVEGTVRASEESAAYQQLESEGLIPIKIASAIERKAQPKSSFFSPRVKPDVVIVFTRQLSTMLRAGIPLVQALETLCRQTENETLKQVLVDMSRQISGGARLSESLAEFPRIFSTQFVSIVISGESGADLVEALMRIASWMERELEIRRKIVSALAYPATVIVALVLAAIIMTVFVIPQFARLYTNSAVQLPLPTRVLVSGNIWMQKYWPLLAGVIAVSIASFVALYRGRPSFRLAIDKMKFSFPCTGRLYSKIAISRFARIFAMLVKNGVSVLQALEVAPGAVANTHLIRSTAAVRKEIEAGSSIYEGFNSMTVFPPIMTNLIAIGERTGALDEMLDYMVEQYDIEIQYELQVFSKTVETIITLIIGVMVMFLALAIFLPIWSMGQLIER